MWTQQRLVLDIAEYTEVAVFLASLLFPVIASFFWPWWKTAMGRNIVVFDLMLSLVYLQFPLGYWFGVSPYAQWLLWLVDASFAAIVPVILWRIATIWIVQRAGIPREGKEKR
jgi:hypothetical protein